MIRFNWKMPTNVIMGDDCIKNNACVFSQFGKRAYVVAARSSRKNGAYDDAASAFEKAGIGYEANFDVEHDPPLASVDAAAEKARLFGADMIVTIGGGSAMDTAKAVAMLMTNKGLDASMLFGRDFEYPSLPIIAVPTTCGTGSEVSPVSVLTCSDNKRSFAHISMSPKVAFLDGRYLRSLPERILLDTVVDALAHAAEGYIMNDNAVADMFCDEVFSLIGEIRCYLGGGVYPKDVLDKLLYLSMVAGLALSINGTSAVHAMGYPLTVKKGYSHGRACGAFLGEYTAMCLPARKEKTAKMLALLGENTVDGFCKWISSLLLPGEHITKDDIEEFTAICAEPACKKNNPIPFTEKEVRRLFEKCLL